MAERKMAERKMADNTLTGKWQKKNTRKMAERKMHDMENGRKCIYRKKAETARPEFDRMENA